MKANSQQVEPPAHTAENHIRLNSKVMSPTDSRKQNFTPAAATAASISAVHGLLDPTTTVICSTASNYGSKRLHHAGRYVIRV